MLPVHRLTKYFNELERKHPGMGSFRLRYGVGALVKKEMTTVGPIRGGNRIETPVCREVDYTRSATTTTEPLTEQKLFYKGDSIINPCNFAGLYFGAITHIEEILRILEQTETITKKEIKLGLTNFDLIKSILLETAKNAIEAVAIKFQEKGFVDAEVRYRVLIKDEELWLQILDNGNGFHPEILGEIGTKPMPTNTKDTIPKELQLGGRNDHLYKTASEIKDLGWKLVVESHNDPGGACVSIVIPLK